ncbi:unnamed protein product [Prunus armeniaca]
MIEPNMFGRNFVKQKLSEGLICTLYVRTKHRLADILTKGVSSKVFDSTQAKLGIRAILQLEGSIDLCIFNCTQVDDD